MKHFNYNLYKKGIADTKVAPSDNNLVDRDGERYDAVISSEDFCNNYEKHIRHISGFKTTKDGRSTFRSSDYPAIGVMDMNDLIQETRAAFLHSYSLSLGKEFDGDGARWSYIKNSTILNLEMAIRASKDGVRVPEWDYKSASKAGKEAKGNIANHLTQLFNKMEVIFSEMTDTDITSYESEVLGFFLDDMINHAIPKQIGRDVVRGIHGMDDNFDTYGKLSEYYRKSQSTIRSVKERAISKLREPLIKEHILDFIQSNKLNVSGTINLDTERVSVTDRIKLKNN